MKVYIATTISIQRVEDDAVCINGAFTSKGVDPELLEDWIGKYGDLRICFDIENHTATVLNGGESWATP